ncbi:hypothetical protein MYX07_06885 [Patescibacteria group bacterium AH-259-L07]|nr:hypothetical protein [Patescibacteria group bacterium AH-259-L07]
MYECYFNDRQEGEYQCPRCCAALCAQHFNEHDSRTCDKIIRETTITDDEKEMADIFDDDFDDPFDDYSIWGAGGHYVYTGSREFPDGKVWVG